MLVNHADDGSQSVTAFSRYALGVEIKNCHVSMQTANGKN
jgi:hypothetical protein